MKYLKIVKKIFFCFVSGVLLSLALLLAGEIITRLYYAFYKNEPRSADYTMVRDNELGWKPRENYTYRRHVRNAKGQKHEIEISTCEYGFRMFGNLVGSHKKRVLFIGDSFTYTIDVSNSDAYYGVLCKRFPIEGFAHGAGGYGTFQEFMIIDKYVDIIKPDALVLQYCSCNDIVDNYYELDKRNHHGLKETRPYLTEKGEIEYRFPAWFPWARRIGNEYSYFLKAFFYRLDLLNIKLGRSVESLIWKKGKDFLPFQKGLLVTERIIRKIRERVPEDVEIYAFEAIGTEPYNEEMKNMSERCGIKFIEGIPQVIKEKEKEGFVVKAEDGVHWNELGHKVAAEKLEEYLRKEWEAEN